MACEELSTSADVRLRSNRPPVPPAAMTVLGSKGHDSIFGKVVEYGSGYSAVRVLNKVDKLMAGEQANAERLDPGRQSVLKGLAGEAAPHARLVVKAGDKLLLLGALGTLRTLEFNTQLPFEPCNCPGNAVDERLDEFGVGNAAADGQDGVDESCSSSSSTGPMRPRPQVPGKKLDPLMVLPALATVTVAPVRAASMAAQRPAMPDPITSTSVDSIGFLSRPAHCRTGDRQWGRKDPANR